ncbi:MAG: ATPase [Acidobacteriota bacterium]|nr:ATPase [Acidobacteriota bacterium]
MTGVQRSVIAGCLWAVLSSGAPFATQAQAAGQSSARANASIASGETSTPEGQSSPKADQQKADTEHDQQKAEKDENEAYRQSPMVVKLGGMMGMNAAQSAAAFELTNFVLLAVLLLWAIVKLVPGALRTRNSAIQRDLVDARTATEQAGARLSGVEERLGKLDAQIAALRLQAEQDAAGDEARIKASIEHDKQQILAAAEQEIAAATTQAQKQLQRYAAELAIEQAARKIVVSAETDRLLVQSFAQRLAGDESKKGQN